MFNKHQNTSKYLEDQTTELYYLYCPHQVTENIEHLNTFKTLIRPMPYFFDFFFLNPSLFDEHTFLARTRVYLQKKKKNHNPEFTKLPSAALLG